jgi:SET domain-containing protein
MVGNREGEMITNICWSPSCDSGNGVFAMRPMFAGTVVEISPVHVIPASESRHCHIEDKPSIHDTHVLGWKDEDSPEEADALGFGYLMLYNHRSPGNVSFERDFDMKVIRVVLKEDVAAGEELFVDYCVPLWFQDKQHSAPGQPCRSGLVTPNPPHFPGGGSPPGGWAQGGGGAS